MKKYFFIVITILLLFKTSVFALEIETESENILLYNLKDEKVIYQKNSDENTKIASLTKIVTVLVALENIEDINEKIVLTEEVFEGLIEADASVAGFKVGEIVTYEDLLYGTLLPSGADASIALAINLFGNERKFVQEMNNLMIKLNIKNTYFTNTSGLDEDGQKATLNDLLTIFLYAFKNDKFMEIFNSSSYTTYNGRLDLKSTLSYYERVYSLDTKIIKGSKTGFTNLAGLCLLSYADFDNMELVLITTNAPVNEQHFPYNVTDALNIYNYYFNNYSYFTLLNNNQVLTSVQTKYSKEKEVNLIYKGFDFKYFLPKDYDKNEIEFEIDIHDNLTFNTRAEKSVASLVVKYQDDKIFTGDLYLENKINFSVIRFVIYYKYIFIGLVIILIIYFKQKKLTFS
ncbi:MAG: hypothetical protein PHG03_00425 [Bacilli bacterium]|nr:hypothetical protein [Bacilli bacterium]MDD4795010.1 hypothetical protein [Bacilli bacterium]